MPSDSSHYTPHEIKVISSSPNALPNHDANESLFHTNSESTITTSEYFKFPTVNLWIISDGTLDQEKFTSKLDPAAVKCEKVLNVAEMNHYLGHLLQDLSTMKPDLIWVILPMHRNRSPVDSRNHIAIRLLLYQQLQDKRHIVVEGATSSAKSQGFFIDPQWSHYFPQLQAYRIWWCSLLPESQLQCVYANTTSTVALPSRYLSCCGRSSKHRGIRPKRTPDRYLLATVKVLRESLSSQLQSTQGSVETVASDPTFHSPTLSESQPPSGPSSSFPTNSKIRKKEKAKGALTWKEEDGPGEHEDVIPLKSSKVVEDHFDDCGDDILPLLSERDDSDVLFAYFEKSDSEFPPLAGTDYFDESDDDIASVIDPEFETWHLSGSMNGLPDFDPPSACYFASFESLYAELSYAGGSSERGADLVEIFGGEGRCTRIAIRRKLRAGPNWDLVCDINLLIKRDVDCLWHYLQTEKPAVVIGGPPCTGLGPWARYNRIHAYDAWLESFKIGSELSKLMAEICYFQWANHRHFIVENPWQSDLWTLPEWTKIMSLEGVRWVRCDQCSFGLTDPTGAPTLKPTCFLASAWSLIWRLSVRCIKEITGHSEHQPLEGHVHGISRCRYAQIWPWKLCQAIISGVIETLNSTSMRHARSTMVSFPTFPAAPERCRGCTSHAARHDDRHNRIPGICRFPDAATLTWECPACIRHLPSTHSTHVFDHTCQWTHAPQRQRGAQRMSGLREPRLTQPVPIADAAAAEPDHPPPVLTAPWTKVTDLALITTLESVSEREGWRSISASSIAYCALQARSLRSCEPRFALDQFRYRSTYAYFPELPHDHGMWWCIEHEAEFASPARSAWLRVSLGFAVPILIHIFTAHPDDATPDAAPTINNTRTTPKSSSSPGPLGASSPSTTKPVDRSTDHWIETTTHWIRIHVQPRQDLFTPTRTRDGPPLESLSTMRITKATHVVSQRLTTIRDNWTMSSSAQRTLATWTGQTLFPKRVRPDLPDSAADNVQIHGQPIDHGEEPEVPIISNPEGQPLTETPDGDPEVPSADPDWSSWDLGRALRALRSTDRALQARALKRLHIRWWHCSVERMTQLLKAAGIPRSAIDMIKPVVSCCRVCRAWQKPSNRSMHNSRLSEKFNDVIQFDLMFVEEHIIGHLCDEATRFSVTAVLPNRETDTILRFITQSWIRLFGPPRTLMSDQEGGLSSEEGAIWFERFGINPKLTPKGAHAAIVERHHQTLRGIIHRVLQQSREEKLDLHFEDVLSESTLAKNIFTNIGGFSPYQAVFGRWPNVLVDLEQASISAIDDHDPTSTSRHVTRLREIAVASMVQSTAQARMRLAENSRTRMASEVLDLQPGTLVDIFRQPSRKDLSGWRGPCEVINCDAGVVHVLWGGRILSCRPQDVRLHFSSVYLIDDGTPQIRMIREHILTLYDCMQTVSWICTENGWQLSKVAKESPSLLNAILFTASNTIHLQKCIGARLGRGFHVLTGLHHVVSSVIIWWPAGKPNLFQTYEHVGTQSIHLRQMIENDQYSDYCWIQFLCTDVPNSRKVRRLDPEMPIHMHDDHDMHPWRSTPKEPIRTEETRRSPMSTGQDTLMPPGSDSSISVDIPSAPHPPAPPGQPSPISIATNQSTGSSGSRLTTEVPRHLRPSSPRSDPIRHGVPSSASSSHRPSKISRVEPNGPPAGSTRPILPINSAGGTSDSSISVIPPAPPPEEPPPLDEDDDLDTLPSTIPYDELTEQDFLSLIEELGCDSSIYAVDDSEAPEKSFGELTPQEIKHYWEECAAGIRKEVQSFVDLGVMVLKPAGTSGNCMSARMVLRWKTDPHTLVQAVKARVCVRGFLDKDKHNEVFASTASRWGQRLITAVCVQNNWKMQTADVGAAFLRGLSFEDLAKLAGTTVRKCAFKFPREYVEFLKEHAAFADYDESKHELFMLKPVYGLRDAPRAWRKRLHQAMCDLKALSLRTDVSIYIWRGANGKITAICSAHVDDLKLGGDNDMVKTIIVYLESQFGSLKIVVGNFEHCGLIHEYQPDGAYHVHQNHFASRLKITDLSGLNVLDRTAVVNEHFKSLFASGVGSLAWLSQTRLDVLIYIQALQRSTKAPTVAHMLRMNCVIKWVKRKPMFLKFTKLHSPSLKTLVISDSAFRREDSSGLAMRGCVIGIAENFSDQVGGHIQMIEFFSRRQRRVVRSTFGAELGSAADGVEIGKLIAYTLAELIIPNLTTAQIIRLDETGGLPVPIQLVTDCRSLYDALKVDDTSIPSESSLLMPLLQLKENLRTGTLQSIVWCDTRDMAADGLNKGCINRQALLQLATTALWSLNHPVHVHSESHRKAIAPETSTQPEKD